MRRGTGKQKAGPRLFAFGNCRQFMRTVAALPRDEIDVDDGDSAGEGHMGDGARSPLLSQEQAAVVRQM